MKAFFERCFTREIRLFAIFFASLFIILAPLQAGVQEDLKAAIQTLDSGGKLGAKEGSVLMRYNMEMQRMAYHGEISEKGFQAAQRFYVNETVEILNKAVKNVNAKYGTHLKVSLQKVEPGKVFEPFADVDAIANATKPDEIRYLLDETDRLLKKHIRNGGLPVSDSIFLPKANDIDIMADPKRTTRKNFEAIADLNNMAYRQREAAIYEAAKRSGGELDLGLTRKYMDEMKAAVTHMDEEIAEKQSELAELLKHNDVNTPGTKEWRRARDLRADIGGCQGKQGKYIERMNEATDIIIKQNGLKETPGMRKGATTSQAKIGKSRWGHNAAESALTSKHSDTAIGEAYRRHADTLAELARQKPGKAGEAAEALSKMKDKLNPKHLRELKKRVANLPDREARQVLGSALAETEEEILELVKHRIPISAKQATASLGDSQQAVKKALAEGNFSKAVKELDILQSDLEYARKYLGLKGGTNPKIDELIEAYRKIVRESSGILSIAGQKKFIEKAMKRTMADPDTLRAVNSFLKKVRMDESFLKLLAGENDPVKRNMLKGLLNQSSKRFGSLMDEFKVLLKDVPMDTLLAGLFSGLDAYDSYLRSHNGDIEGASRKLYEAFVGAIGGVTEGLNLAIANMILDAAKDAGYTMAATRQDLDDFLAGIISVTGWENASSVDTIRETSVKKLAHKHAALSDVKKELKSLIKLAADNSDDTETKKREKSKALEDHLWPKLRLEWLKAREQMVGEFQAAAQRFHEAKMRTQIQIYTTPEKVPLVHLRKTNKQMGNLSIKVQAEGDIEACQRALEDMRNALYRLGGERRLMSLSFEAIVTVYHPETGQVALQEKHSDFTRILMEGEVPFTTPGKHEMMVRLETKITPLSFVTEFAFDKQIMTGILQMIPHPTLKQNWLGKKDVLIDERKIELGWNWGNDYREEVQIRQNYSDIIADAEKHEVLEIWINVVVEESKLTDDVHVRIAGHPEVLPGQTAFFKAEVKSDSPKPSQVRFSWQGVDKVFSPDLKVNPSEVPMESSTQAMLMRETPGLYPVALLAERVLADGTSEKINVRPIELKVLATDELNLAVQIDGPAEGRMLAGHDAKISAHWYTIPNRLMLQKILREKRLYFAWMVDGSFLDYGDDITVTAYDEGERLIEAHLYEKDVMGNEKLLAKGEYTLSVEIDPDSPPDVPPEAEDSSDEEDGLYELEINIGSNKSSSHASTFEVGERINLTAKFIGERPKGNLYWKWSANKGSRISNPGSSRTSVIRKEPGKVLLKLKVTNKDYKVLAEAEKEFEVVEQKKSSEDNPETSTPSNNSPSERDKSDHKKKESSKNETEKSNDESLEPPIHKQEHRSLEIKNNGWEKTSDGWWYLRLRKPSLTISWDDNYNLGVVNNFGKYTLSIYGSLSVEPDQTVVGDMPRDEYLELAKSSLDIDQTRNREWLEERLDREWFEDSTISEYAKGKYSGWILKQRTRHSYILNDVDPDSESGYEWGFNGVIYKVRNLSYRVTGYIEYLEDKLKIEGFIEIEQSLNAPYLNDESLNTICQSLIDEMEATLSGIQLKEHVLRNEDGELEFVNTKIIYNEKPLTQDISSTNTNFENSAQEENLLYLKPSTGRPYNIGQSVTFHVKLQSKSEETWDYFWSKGEVSSDGKSTTVELKRPETDTIVVDAKGSKGTELSATYEVDVELPKFSIKLSPTQPYIDETVTAQITSHPTLGEDIMHYRWIEPSTKHRLELNDQASKAEIDQLLPEGMQIIVQAKTAYYGDDLGEITASVPKPKLYKIEATAKRLEPTKREFDPDKKGFVDTASKPFETHERILTKVEFKGDQPKETPRWQWSANKGTTISNASSKTPTITRSESGSVVLEVKAVNEEGVTLAKTSLQFQVTEPPKEIVKETPPLEVEIIQNQKTVKPKTSVQLRAKVKGGKPPYKYKWQAEGIRNLFSPTTVFKHSVENGYPIQLTITDADGIKTTVSSEIVVDNEGSQADKEKAFDANVKRGREFENSQQYDSAIKEYEQALENKDDPQVREKIKELQGKIDEREQFNDLIQQGRKKVLSGEFEEALDLLKKAQDIRDGEVLQDLIRKAENGIIQQKMDKNRKAAEKLAGKGKYQEALDKLKEGRKIGIDLSAPALINKWTKLLKEQKIIQKRADVLVQQAEQYEAQRDLTRALSSYKAAEKIISTQNNQSKIKELEDNIEFINSIVKTAEEEVQNEEYEYAMESYKVAHDYDPHRGFDKEIQRVKQLAAEAEKRKSSPILGAWWVEDGTNGKNGDYNDLQWEFSSDGTVKAKNAWSGTWTPNGDRIEVNIGIDRFYLKLDNQSEFTAYKNGSTYRYGNRTKMLPEKEIPKEQSTPKTQSFTVNDYSGTWELNANAHKGKLIIVPNGTSIMHYYSQKKDEVLCNLVIDPVKNIIRFDRDITAKFSQFYTGKINAKGELEGTFVSGAPPDYRWFAVRINDSVEGSEDANIGRANNDYLIQSNKQEYVIGPDGKVVASYKNAQPGTQIGIFLHRISPSAKDNIGSRYGLGDNQGEWSFKIPQIPGEYRFELRQTDQKISVMGDPFTIKSGTYTIEAHKNEYVIGPDEEITAAYKNAQPGTQIGIFLHRISPSAKDNVGSRYGLGDNQGEWSFKIPNIPGKYRFELRQTSQKVSVIGDTFTIKTGVYSVDAHKKEYVIGSDKNIVAKYHNPNPKAQMGIFLHRISPSEKDKVKSRYGIDKGRGEWSFKVPQTPGEYQLEFYQKSPAISVKSDTFRIR